LLSIWVVFKINQMLLRLIYNDNKKSETVGLFTAASICINE